MNSKDKKYLNPELAGTLFDREFFELRVKKKIKKNN